MRHFLTFLFVILLASLLLAGCCYGDACSCRSASCRATANANWNSQLTAMAATAQPSTTPIPDE